MLVTALVALLVGGLGAPAAVDRPGATATAQRGSLKVVSRVLLDDRGGELMGTWLDTRARCSATRRLRVSYEIDLVLPNGTTVRRRPAARTGAVQNCAEGGPNFGFLVRARGLGMACASGAWRPGRYSIGVRTVDLGSGLAAHAFLYHQVTRC
ncbi:MAG TPA: hypothetical protein VM204_03750 [Gaiellaceae bacterium]|nr:hypothetical protein [Gaiellaceae bacterium]